MGRGRAKAKQTKVARELKYSSPTMDLDALQREIGSGTTANKEPEVDDYDDPYAAYIDDDEDAPDVAVRSRPFQFSPAGVISVTHSVPGSAPRPPRRSSRCIVGNGFSAGRGD